jgi:hypothetical protein
LLTLFPSTYSHKGAQFLIGDNTAKVKPPAYNLHPCINLIYVRWYQNHKVDSKTIPGTPCGYAMSITRRPKLSVSAAPIQATQISNPPENGPSQASPPPTATVPARTVLQTAEAALRPLLHGVQTQEQLDDLVQNLEDLWSVFTI